MRSRCCGLILSLNLAIFAGAAGTLLAIDTPAKANGKIEVVEQKNTAQASQSDVQVLSTEQTQAAGQPPQSAEQTGTVEQTVKEPVSQNAKPAAETRKENKKALQSQPDDADINKRVDSLNGQYQLLSSSFSAQDNLLREIKRQQEQMVNTVKMLEESKYSSSTSSSAFMEQVDRLIKEQEKMMALISSISDNQEKMRSEIEKINTNPMSAYSRDQSTSTSAASNLSASKGALSPASVSLEDKDGQQFIKVKFMEDGQEVELCLDPTYVDMQLDFAKAKQQQQPVNSKNVQPQKATDDPEFQKMMDYVSRSIENRTVNTKYDYSQNGQPPVQQAQMSPSQPGQIQQIYYPVQMPQQPGQQQDQKEKNGKQDSVNSAQADAVQQDLPRIEDTRTSEQLYRAQKLFYGKKYNAALNAVQKSLSIQPTALGYALEGSIYYTLGDVELAISSWEAALKLDPNMTEVKKALFKYKR